MNINRISTMTAIFNLVFSLPVSLVVIGCSSNGIEGTVECHGSREPLANVTVEARTETDIVQEQSKALKTTETDANGHFKITGLIPHNTYKVAVSDGRYVSYSEHVTAPEEGIRRTKGPIVACPLPPREGIWIYDYATLTPELLQLDNSHKVRTRIHAGIISGLLGRSSAFSVAPENIGNILEFLPEDAMLVISGGAVKSIGRLYHVPYQEYWRHNIPEGWYLNISGFRHGDADISRPLFDDFSLKQHSLWATDLSSLPSGLYFLVTQSASRQRTESVIGGEKHARSGYIIGIGDVFADTSLTRSSKPTTAAEPVQDVVSPGTRLEEGGLNLIVPPGAKEITLLEVPETRYRELDRYVPENMDVRIAFYLDFVDDGRKDAIVIVDNAKTAKSRAELSSRGFVIPDFADASAATEKLDITDKETGEEAHFGYTSGECIAYRIHGTVHFAFDKGNFKTGIVHRSGLRYVVSW